MRLLSLTITGFGKLEGESFSFSGGRNTIKKENGWGKTTFAAFLKAMFYGLEYRPGVRRLTEREHYRPWSGGTYGGSLTFETEKGRFTVERTFGKKAGEDTFALKDADTGLHSDAYSDKLGEEVFGVDRESFERSVFVPQGGQETGMTDSLNAKIGDLETARNDMNQFDAALKRLDEAKRSYTRTSKVNTGKLVSLREKIRDAEDVAGEIPALMEAYTQKKKLLEGRRKKLIQMEFERKLIAKRISDRSAIEQTLGAYREKKALAEKRQGEISGLEDFFSRGIPEEEDLKAEDDLLQDLKAARAKLNELEKGESALADTRRREDLFSGGIPSDEDMAGWRKEADQLKALRMKSEAGRMSSEDKEELASLREEYKKGFPNDEEKREVQEAEALRQQVLGKRQAVEENLKAAEEKAGQRVTRHFSGGLPVFLLLLAGVLILGSFFIPSFFTGTAGLMVRVGMWGIGGLLVILLFTGTLSERKKVSGRKKEDQEKTDDLRDQLKGLDEKERDLSEAGSSFLAAYPGGGETVTDRISNLQHAQDRLRHLTDLEKRSLETASASLEDLTALQLQLYTELRPYAESYGIDLYKEMNEADLLSRLEEDRKKAGEEARRKKEEEETREKAGEMETSLRDFLSRFPNPDSLSAQDLLARIRTQRDLYIRLSDEEEKAREELAAAEKSLPDVSEGETVESLQAKESDLDAGIGELNRFIPKDMEAVSALSDSIVSHDDTKESLISLREEERAMKERVDILNQTIDYLKKARDRFLSRYMGPLRGRMQHYLDLLDGKGHGTDEGAGDRVELDMDLSIHVIHQGLTHTNAYLSTGYQDLTYLAARFALIDVLYPGEKPCLILDDPFTDLDEDRVARALSLLDLVGKDQQIIYFTCHASRA